jgi:hypothetical protein
MFTSKIRISIITAVAALSILSVGTFTSVASARPPVKVGKIEIDCPVQTGDGGVEWRPEGSTMTVAAADDEGTVYFMTLQCKGGSWVSVGQVEAPSAPTRPKTNEEGPSITSAA